MPVPSNVRNIVDKLVTVDGRGTPETVSAGELSICEEYCQQSFANETTLPVFCNPLFNPKLQPRCEPTVIGFEHEIAAAMEIEGVAHRYDTMCDIIAAVTKAGLKEEAKIGVFDKLIMATREDDVYVRHSILSCIIAAIETTGLFDRLITGAREIIEEEGNHAYYGVEILGKIFVALAKAGRKEKARGLLEELIGASIYRLNNSRERYSIAQDVAKAVAKAGLMEEAMGVIGKLKAEADERDDGDSEMVIEFYDVFVATGLTREEVIISRIDRSITTTMEIEDEFTRCERLIEVINAVAEAKLEEEAKAGLFNKLIAATREFKDARSRSITLYYIKIAVAKTGLERRVIVPNN